VTSLNPAQSSSSLSATTIRAFEAEALDQLPALMGVARRLTRNQAEAEDLVQDTFVKALRARGQYQAGTNLKAWLLKILKNTFINRYHRANLERATLATPLADPMTDGWMSHASMAAMRDPEAMALKPQLEEALSRCIDDLPEEFRMVVLLADAQGFSYKEVAETLGCPLGTVMSRLHRARRQLKSRLVHLARERGWVLPETMVGSDSSGSASSGSGSEEAPIELATYRANMSTEAAPKSAKARGKGRAQ
jgi:RNA polymerase sigma-70 factor, ECF subfamily